MATAGKKTYDPPVAAPPQVSLADVFSRLDLHGRSYDRERLQQVYELSAEMHRDQVRRSGEPYLSHPLAVAWLLADLKLDQTCVAVGLLHDVLEDTLTTREVLESRFGSEIAELVDGVTKIGRHEYVRRDQAQAETFRKMILASARDIRVILVKLVDRLHNMQTLDAMSPEHKRRISQETLEIYAPIANRLGMARVKGDLEDLAFYYLYPHQFGELARKIEEKTKGGAETMERVARKLREKLDEAEIEADISYRSKRFYSIYQKLRRQGIDISQLYDFLAFRIVTGNNLRDTYAALGIVHQSWRPIPGRFKDYIAMPKANLYQSLHTTVVGESGQPFEVQIRTREMDLVAEEGIAAHWRYKEGRLDPGESDRNILWLRQLLEWQQDVSDPRTFLTNLKVDLYPEEVYVFTPKGAVMSFPRGATPLDFAYKVHTDLGHHCVGARVNGKLVPMREALSNGDMVEVMTNPNRNPSRDWLSFVVTSRAKNKIRQWLNTQQRQRALEIGKRLLERELKKYKVSPRRFMDSPELDKLLQDDGLSRLEDLYTRIGFGKAPLRQILVRVLGEGTLAAEPVPVEKPSALRRAVSKILPFGSGAGPIAVRGHGDLLAFLAKCCNPLPGDEIVGYVTRGRGVSVHAVDCQNVRNLLYDPEREIEVEWARPDGSSYPVNLVLETEDQPGMLARVTELIAKEEGNIRQIDAETVDTGRGIIAMTVEVRNRKHLEKVKGGLRALPGVIKVDRRMTDGRTVSSTDGPRAG
jgi:GTP pyrophosphokinase